ncbi:MAG: hypothetical protein V1736_09415 [Pseudomonadota bacterium]
MDGIIGEREIFAVSATGERRSIRIAVGMPYRVNGDSWSCPVRMEGLRDRIHDAVGVDSWQALVLAIGLVRQILWYFLEDGGRLFWEEGGKEMALDDILPLLKISKDEADPDQ